MRKKKKKKTTRKKSWEKMMKIMRKKPWIHRRTNTDNDSVVEQGEATSGNIAKKKLAAYRW